LKKGLIHATLKQRMKKNNISPLFAYFLGLIIGRGHIFPDSFSIAIEFSHHNEFSYGIAYCPNCGFLATKNKDILFCKKCKKPVSPKVRNVYNQPKSTTKSLVSSIIPFLQEEINAKYEIISSKSMTLLVMDFKNNKKQFELIRRFFGKENSFDRFHIPKKIFSLSKKSKIEFVNGLLDTSGFTSVGGWLNRDGKKGYGRMRAYFQIVRNWTLPVEIDNFLRKEFSLPIHTIDWGHPNIRDGNLRDFFNTRPTSWSREHQVKIFPEYYKIFHFRIEHKQRLFEELIVHNQKADFVNKEDWFPPGPISKKRLKPYHPGENDLRIPSLARRHFDAFWQINLAMGCSFLKKFIEKLKNPEVFSLIGKDENFNLVKLEKVLDAERKKITEEIYLQHKKETKEKKVKIKKAEKRIEKDLYSPIANYLKEALIQKYEENIETFDTSSVNLNAFLKDKSGNLLDLFTYCERFVIKPDVVGFLLDSRKMIFVEVKVTQLDLKSLGQLLGYCLVANPIEAILISSEKPSTSLIKILKAKPGLLSYSKGKRIKIGIWEENKIILLI